MTEEKPKRKRTASRTKKEKNVIVVRDDDGFLDKIGAKQEWLGNLALQYNFDRFEYVHKFRAFRCYRGAQHVEWVDVNELSLLNGGRRLVEIRLKHQPVSKSREIIERPWR